MRREIGSVPYDDEARLRFGDPEHRVALSVAANPAPCVELLLRICRARSETGRAGKRNRVRARVERDPESRRSREGSALDGIAFAAEIEKRPGIPSGTALTKCHATGGVGRHGGVVAVAFRQGGKLRARIYAARRAVAGDARRLLREPGNQRPVEPAASAGQSAAGFAGARGAALAAGGDVARRIGGDPVDGAEGSLLDGVAAVS